MSRVSSKREIIDFSLVTSARWSSLQAFGASREIEDSGLTGG